MTTHIGFMKMLELVFSRIGSLQRYYWFWTLAYICMISHFIVLKKMFWSILLSYLIHKMKFWISTPLDMIVYFKDKNVFKCILFWLDCSMVKQEVQEFWGFLERVENCENVVYISINHSIYSKTTKNTLYNMKAWKT